MFGLKPKHIHESIVSFAVILALLMIKNKLLDKPTNMTEVIITALFWALQYLLRKMIVRHIPE